MRLAVIIPAYNHLAEVMRCLNSLRHFASDATVTYHVQDDCSPELDLRDCIPTEIASCIRNPVNLGFAANCNTGAATLLDEQAADVLCFVNQDVTASYPLSANWDAALLSAFADPTVGVVAPRLLFTDGSIQSVGGTFDQLAQPIHRCLGWTKPEHQECSMPCEIEWATGAAYAIRAELFMRLGGFDERYRMYFEDTDLSLRVREAGYKIMFEPRCTLIHSVGSTGGSPHFMNSARLFKLRWVDSGKVKPGRLAPVMRYW